MKFPFTCLIALVTALPCSGFPPLRAVPALPDPHGFAGMFGGVSGQHLICAGGANFPDLPLAQGGQKVWHDTVFALGAAGEWQRVGRLPRPNGYGVSATWNDQILIAGGGDAVENFASAFTMVYDGAALQFTQLPDLPLPLANATGSIVGSTLFVAGGQTSPSATAASARCFVLDLAEPTRRWREIPWPDGAPARILAVAASLGGCFYLIGGAELIRDPQGKIVRRYLDDAWRYREDTGWEKLPTLPRGCAAAPSPAFSTAASTLQIHSGVWPGYLARYAAQPRIPGFTGDWLEFDPRRNTWSELSSTPHSAIPRVTAPAVVWSGHYVVLSGESAPGIRTNTILTLAP
jgi:N-acetylneuraminic acid mutarotase